MTEVNTIGARLREARRERGLTQEALAELAGMSSDVIGKLEQGQRETARITTLSRLANALGITLSDLLGRRERLETASAAGVLEVRNALLSPADILPGIDPVHDEGTATPLPDLERAVRKGWSHYWAGELGALTKMLPGLIGEARFTAAEAGPAAAGALAQSYQLAADLMVHTGHDDLAAVAAERSVAAARGGDDPLQHAMAVGTASWVLLHQGRHAEAERVAVRAADDVEPRLRKATPEQVTVYGSLLLTAAAPAASAGRADETGEYVGEARAAAARWDEDRHDYWTSFGPTQVAMQDCYTSTTLGRPARALKAAEKVRRENLLHISYGAHKLDVAQALADSRRDRDAIEALQEARAVSDEWFRHQGLARSLVRELVERQRRLSGPLKSLAQSVGVR